VTHSQIKGIRGSFVGIPAQDLSNLVTITTGKNKKYHFLKQPKTSKKRMNINVPEKEEGGRGETGSSECCSKETSGSRLGSMSATLAPVLNRPFPY